MKKELGAIMAMAAMAAAFEQPHGWTGSPKVSVSGNGSPNLKPNRKRVKPKQFRKPKKIKNKMQYAITSKQFNQCL